MLPQPEFFIGTDSIEVVRFILNRDLSPVDHYKVVFQRICSILRSVALHARYTLFEASKKLVVSLII
jgi:hypothetical protein